MSVPGITGSLSVYLTHTHDANANYSPSGSALTLKGRNFQFDANYKSETDTGLRSPGENRGETGTFTTEVGKVSFEGFFPDGSLAYEGDAPVIPKRSVIYIEFANDSGTYFVNTAMRVENVSYTNSTDGLFGYKIDGPTQGNWVTHDD